MTVAIEYCEGCDTHTLKLGVRVLQYGEFLHDVHVLKMLAAQLGATVRQTRKTSCSACSV